MASPEARQGEQNLRDVFLMGSRIYLRGLREEDLDGSWYRWFNDEEVTYYQDKGYFPNSRDKQREYFRAVESSTADLVLAVIDAETDRHVGNVGLHKIDWIHRSAVVGIVIGEKDAWGKGFGKEAIQLITRHGIEILNLNKITATIIDGNAASFACFSASGYQVEGRQREQMYRHGCYHDLVLVGLTASAWSQGTSSEGASPAPSSRG